MTDEPVDIAGSEWRPTNALRRHCFLMVLKNSARPVPIGLSELADPNFTWLVENEMVDLDWTGEGNIVAVITDIGRDHVKT